jgi:REP element-mobilizing transposase RayT
MPGKFKGKYRIDSARLRNWDYGWNAPYYVTIKTKNRKCFFGEIKNEEMFHTEIGHIANQYWLEIPKHFPFVELDEFIVMPNHIHGILIINKQDGGGIYDYNHGQIVETQNFVSLQQQFDHDHDHNPTHIVPSKNKFGPQSQNLGSIMRGFKSAVKTYSTTNNIEFKWQSRFHDHIIRNDLEFKRIANYIRNNPANWGKEKPIKKGK